MTLTTEVIYPISFTQSNKRFVLGLVLFVILGFVLFVFVLLMKRTASYLLMLQKTYQFDAKKTLKQKIMR